MCFTGGYTKRRAPLLAHTFDQHVSKWNAGTVRRNMLCSIFTSITHAKALLSGDQQQLSMECGNSKQHALCNSMYGCMCIVMEHGASYPPSKLHSKLFSHSFRSAISFHSALSRLGLVTKQWRLSKEEPFLSKGYNQTLMCFIDLLVGWHV